MMNQKEVKLESLRTSRAKCRLNRKRAETSPEKKFWLERELDYDKEIKSIMAGSK